MARESSPTRDPDTTMILLTFASFRLVLPGAKCSARDLRTFLRTRQTFPSTFTGQTRCSTCTSASFVTTCSPRYCAKQKRCKLTGLAGYAGTNSPPV